ncbi:MAG: NDP-sugar synthase [Desulfopila sp.]|jgi:mannose-1-phosphate guanylyltransferase|nr:NDP-sugar synthase [Desulfopila sp.]
MQAMILAAGLGTRLLPYTTIRPKPLFPILNIPLLLAAVQRLQSCGFTHIIVNCHHLGHQIERELDGISGVILQQEEVLLGTGGALGRAREHMLDEPLLVTNGDIYHTIDLAEFYRRHQQQGAQVSLAVHDYPRFNTLLVDEGRVCRFKGNGIEGSLAVTGIHVLDPAIMDSIDPLAYSCIIDRYKDMLCCEKTIAAVRVDGCYWKDMGTVEDYLELHSNLLTKKVPCWAEMRGGPTPFLLAEDAVVRENLTLQDWCAVGRATIGRNVCISRSVVWDDAVIPDNSRIIDTIVF